MIIARRYVLSATAIGITKWRRKVMKSENVSLNIPQLGSYKKSVYFSAHLYTLNLLSVNFFKFYIAFTVHFHSLFSLPTNAHT
jgi:hypothetical protein